MAVRLGGLASSLVCGGCGARVPPEEPYPFRCPRAGDGGDHVLQRVLDHSRVSFPSPGSSEPEPFVRYRRMLHSYHLALAGGMSDEAYVDMVRELDGAVVGVDGRGFAVTPLTTEAALSEALGLSHLLLVKDETGNVSGSHKGRHLFGLLLNLEVAERIGLVNRAERRPLAIASCGNAALAAAVVAAAGGRELRVFVPTDADESVVRRLEELGASVTVCEREPGRTGDPTYHRLQQAIAEGAVPFTCQGNENGLAIEGGETLGYEIASSVSARSQPLDAVVVQVGGGALASAVAASFQEAAELEALAQVPRLYTLQTESAFPLKRAFDRIVEEAETHGGAESVEPVLHEAARHRSEYMWAWESAPHSIAHGILDDETYDWLAVCKAMLATGGAPAVVGEEELAKANSLAVEKTGIPVDPTGSSGLAGLVKLLDDGHIHRNERVAILFTGVQR